MTNILTKFVLPFTAFLVAVIGIWLYSRPTDFDPVEYSLGPVPQLKNEFAVNTHLRNAELLLKGKISGPESLLIEGNTIYTGTWDGKLVKIVDGKIEKTLRVVGKKGLICGTFDTESVCGRPLGLRRIGTKIIFADAYLGIFKADFENETIEPIFPADKKIDSKRCAFFNDLDVLDNRILFFSDSSTKWDRRRFLYEFLEGKPNGRLIKLDLETGTAELVLKELYFPNGVQLHPDGKSVLISECTRSRIIRYYFDGPKKGSREIFADNLPGFPDNIRLSSKQNTFFVALAAVRHSEELFPFMDKLGSYPWLRKAIIQIIPGNYLEKLHNLLSKKHGFVLELNLEGKVIRSYQDPTGEVIPSVSQVSDDGAHMYLGSFHSDFIAKVPKKGH